MPKLKIDGMEVEVPEGTNVLEAAKKVGIVIPHFCYHPALGSVGACRLCAMKFTEGPVKGVQMSCMVEARDGMVVSTTDGDAAKLRAMVIEWLMLNHPHDCPVCDEGGMCLLQDYTVSGGHGRRRYKGRKRAYPSQYLGEFIQHEMNRCIQCYRCSRFYNDYAGGVDFGPMQIANKVYFGRFKEGWLESPFSGNLADVCPTGVFTDKTYRFKARLWDLEQSPSVCPHCSLGCNVTPGARYRQLLRVEARENRKVNGWFICDRGRFGHGFTARKDRPRSPRAYGIAADYENALAVAATRLKDVMETYGGGAVAFMGSPRAPAEANYALGKLAGAAGSSMICYSPEPGRERKDRLAASLLTPGLARPLKGVESSDFVLAAGVDPLNEAPMLALLMRQAARNGARVYVIDPRPVDLPFKFTHIPVQPDGLADSLSEVLSRELKESSSPTIVAGTDICGPRLIERAAREAGRLKDAGLDSGLIYVMAGPGSFGCALLASGGPDFDDILYGINGGLIKALVVMESDPLGRYPDEEAALAAFSKLEALVVMDYLPTGTAGRAHIFMPTTAPAEDDGTFVNNEGRAQGFARAYMPGIPINCMGPEPHPPRAFFREVPGMTKPAWLLLGRLSSMLGRGYVPHETIEGVRRAMADEDPAWRPLAGLDPDGDGVVLARPSGYTAPSPPPEARPYSDGLMLIAVELTFGTEELSTYSDKTQMKAPEPYVMVNPADVSGPGLYDGARVEVRCGDKSLACVLRLSGGLARGVALAPRLAGFSVAGLSGKRVTICPTA